LWRFSLMSHCEKQFLSPVGSLPSTMKPNPSLRSFLSALGSSLVAVCSAYAVDMDGTWTKNATGTQNWSDPLNWSVGNVADGIGFSAYLSNVIDANRTITLDTARTIGNIYAQDTTHDYTISGANTLTLDASSGQSILDVVSGRTLNIGTAVTVNDGIEKTGAGAVSITGAVSLGASQTWTNNSAGALTKTNASLINNNGYQLTFDGTGIFNLGTINSATAVLTGSGALVKNDSGRLNIGGVNSGFTGTVTINGGVLQMTNNAGALGTGNWTLNGGVLSVYWDGTYTRTLGTGNDQVQILGGESGFAGSGTSGPTYNLGSSVTWGSTYFNPSKFILGDSGTTNNALTTFSSAINLNGETRTIVVPKGLGTAGNRSTISGAISNSTGNAGLIKEGDGWLFLTAAPTYNGTTTVSGGLLDLAALNLNSMGGGAGVRSISIAAGAAVRRNSLDNAFLNRLVETSNEIGVMTGATANNLDFSSSTGANLPNAFLGNWASNGAKAEISGTITPGSNGYLLGAKGSSGLLGIVGTNKITGANSLTVGQTGASGIRVELAAANDFTGNTVINAGAKLTLGNNLALQNSALNLGSAGGTFALSNGLLSGRTTGSIATPSPTFGGLIGSRNLFSAFTSTGGNNEQLLANTAVTGFTLNVATGNTHTYSGAIGGFGSGAVSGTGGDSSLTKTGAGTQILDGTSTYTGGTFINGGKLALGALGAIDNTSAVVLGGGTFDVSAKVGGYAVINLAGSGAVIGSLTVSTALSIGASTGTINFENLTMGALSTFTYEVTGGDTNADLANVSGTLTLTAGTVLDLVQLGTFTVGDKFTLFGYTTGNLTGTFDGLGDGDEFTAAGGDWKILYEDTSAGLNGGTGTSFVTVTAIPEPAAALLGGLGLLMLLRRRR
jgi:autotransporter-associated beta strand protein